MEIKKIEIVKLEDLDEETKKKHNLLGEGWFVEIRHYENGEITYEVMTERPSHKLRRLLKEDCLLFG